MPYLGKTADEEDYSSDSFPIPKTDLTLEFYQFGPLLNPIHLKSFVSAASSDIQHQIDQSSTDAASPEPCYNVKSDGGLVLEIWSISMTPEGYGSLGELRDVINGLSLYMMQGGQSRAVRFHVIQNLGATKAIVVNVGSIRKDVARSITEAKRKFPRSPLVQYSPATSSNTGLVNTSTLSLATTEDFPIPHSDYSLKLTEYENWLHPRDLLTLLSAASAEIDEQIVAHGRNARLPSREYSKDSAGLQFWVQAMPWHEHNLHWAELALFVHGLRLYMVDGGHNYETLIEAMNHVIGGQVALGWIGKPQRPSEPMSLTTAARRAL